MESPVPSNSAKTYLATSQADRIKHLPAEARAAFQRFQTLGDPAGLDMVICAILADFMPRRPTVPLAERPGKVFSREELLRAVWGYDQYDTHLVEVHVANLRSKIDLFGITITNEEMVHVRTLDDLRGFIRRKVAVHAPR